MVVNFKSRVWRFCHFIAYCLSGKRELGSGNFVHTRTFFHAAVVVVILGFTVILNLKLNPKGYSKIFRRTLPTIVR